MGFRSTALMVGAAVLAAAAHEPARAARPLDAPLHEGIAPSAGVLRVVSLGRPTLAASLLWIQACARYGATVEAPDAATTRWIHRAILTAGELDPAWAAPYVFGSMMLERLGDVDAQEDVLQVAIARRPEEPWFPFTLAMSRYRNRGDATGALVWLERAAAIPGADPGYARALEAMRARHPQVPR